MSEGRQVQRARRIRRQRWRAASVAALVVLVVAGVIVASCNGGTATTTTTASTTPPRSGTGSSVPHPASAAGSVGAARAQHGRQGPPSIEAGVEAWPLGAPLSRETVAANGSTLTVLGGITPAGTSLAGVSTIVPGTGAMAPAATLADPTHDAGTATIGKTTFVFGGGSPDTVATVQAVADPTAPPATVTTGTVVGQLPQPRSDLAVATVTGGRGAGTRTTAYLVGGYDGSNYLPGVLATSDGTHFTTVARLAIPVRYPAVVAAGGMVYCFGGQTASSGSSPTATDAIQRIDPATHRTTVVGHLPQALYGAAATVLGTTAYMAGGQSPGGPTLTQITAFVPSSGKVLHAGLLPQATAFAGYATVGSGPGAIGYMVGGEVTAQTG